MTLTIEGELELSSQEGGYAQDAITVNDTALDEWIAKHLKVKSDGVGLRGFGPVRITIETIEPAEETP